MGERPDDIAREIWQTRVELGANLRDLESRVKDVTDWRWQFRQNPLFLLGLAFLAGLVLSGIKVRAK